MTKREAIKFVKRVAARTMRYDIDNGSGWIYDDDGKERPEADIDRIKAAIEIVAERLEREAAR